MGSKIYDILFALFYGEEDVPGLSEETLKVIFRSFPPDEQKLFWKFNDLQSSANHIYIEEFEEKYRERIEGSMANIFEQQDTPSSGFTKQSSEA